MTSSVISFVVCFPPRSGVSTFASIVASTAFSIATATSGSPSDIRSIIAALKIAPHGFAIP